MAKITLGTGSSILMNTGSQAVHSSNGMLTTICWSMDNRVDYALEGAIVACGSTLEWLKNELQLFNIPSETEQMATAVEDNGGVYLIPAFSGLGAPFWQMDRKASIHGMTFGSSKNHIVRAALESIPFQVKSVIEAMGQDMNTPLKRIAVNGGIANNKFVISLLVDLLNLPLTKQANTDISAAGAAYLSGLRSGVFQSMEQLSLLQQKHSTSISPDLNNDHVNQYYQEWQNLIRAGSNLKGNTQRCIFRTL
jgi:glycerol kinase